MSQAVEWARQREAKVFELRALRDLIKIGNVPEEIRSELREVLNGLPHVDNSPDLRDAEAMLCA